MLVTCDLWQILRGDQNVFFLILLTNIQNSKNSLRIKDEEMNCNRYSAMICGEDGIEGRRDK